MQKFLIFGFTLVCALSSLGQQPNVNAKDDDSEIRIKKQIIWHDLEMRVREIPFATVRVFVRYKVAAWLWKNGKDDTGRAENTAARAVDDLFENRSDIPDVYFNSLRPDLFALLDSNAKDTAKALREKHKIDLENDLFDSLLDQDAGEVRAVDAAVKSLVNESHTNPELSVLMWRLQQRKSSQLLRLLTAIVSAEETGRTMFGAQTLLFISNHFVEPDVPIQIQKRFLRIVVDKARKASVTTDGDVEGFFNLLTAISPTVSTRVPELLAELGVVKAVLKTRISQELRDANERTDRINNSSDKLSALVSEAEHTDNKITKYEMYSAAAHLALKLKKFVYSVDLIEKCAGIDMSSTSISESSRQRERDQFMGQVVADALEESDPDSARYGTKKTVDPLSRAESHRKIANYYFDHADPVSARYAIDEAIKLVTQVEVGNQRIFSLIKLLPTAQKVDRNRLPELSELTAKSINSIPSLQVDDKPRTENYRKYVESVMSINWNLLPALTKLFKENKNGAENLASRIDKKEVRIVADLVLMTNSIVEATTGGKQERRGN